MADKPRNNEGAFPIPSPVLKTPLSISRKETLAVTVGCTSLKCKEIITSRKVHTS